MMNNNADGHPIPEGQAQSEWGPSAAVQLQPYTGVLSFGDLFQFPFDIQSVGPDPQTVPDAQTAQPFLRTEASEMTKAVPDFYTDDSNLVTLQTNGKTLLFSQDLNKYFAQRGGQFEIKINHGILNQGEVIRLTVNHTQARLIASVVKTCQKETHRAYQKPNIDFILTIDDPQTQGPKIEYMKDPFTGKLSVKVYPASGTAETSLMARFNCFNGCSCMEKKHDKQWNLLVSKEKENLQVINRASIEIKAVEKPPAELNREEIQKKKKELGLPGRGRKRKADGEEVITLHFQSVNPPSDTSSGSSEDTGIQMMNNSQEHTFIILEDTVPAVVTEPSPCSYNMIVNKNTPRDELENKFVNLKSHLSDEQLIEFINSKMPIY